MTCGNVARNLVKVVTADPPSDLLQAGFMACSRKAGKSASDKTCALKHLPSTSLHQKLKAAGGHDGGWQPSLLLSAEALDTVGVQK